MRLEVGDLLLMSRDGGSRFGARAAHNGHWLLQKPPTSSPRRQLEKPIDKTVENAGALP
jgi:hypothetical protein